MKNYYCNYFISFILRRKVITRAMHSYLKSIKPVLSFEIFHKWSQIPKVSLSRYLVNLKNLNQNTPPYQKEQLFFKDFLSFQYSTFKFSKHFLILKTYLLDMYTIPLEADDIICFLESTDALHFLILMEEFSNKEIPFNSKEFSNTLISYFKNVHGFSGLLSLNISNIGCIFVDDKIFFIKNDNLPEGSPTSPQDFINSFMSNSSQINVQAASVLSSNELECIISSDNSVPSSSTSGSSQSKGFLERLGFNFNKSIPDLARTIHKYFSSHKFVPYNIIRSKALA